MMLHEVRLLEVGIEVFVFNGKCETKVTVTNKELHPNRQDWWIDFEWSKRGKKQIGRKKHSSVNLESRGNWLW